MSIITPCQYAGVPSAWCTSRASSLNQTMRPSRAIMRYSTENGSLRRSDSRFTSSTICASSGWIEAAHTEGSATHSSGSMPRSSLTRELMYTTCRPSPVTSSE